MLIVGASELGKSYLVLQMGLDMASGRAVLGQWEVEKPLKVALIQAEVSPRRFQERCGKLRATYPELVNENLRVATYRLGALFDKRGAPALEEACSGYDVVCLDPLRPFHGYDENDSRQMGQLFMGLGRLVDRTGAAVILVHHERKPTGMMGGGGKFETRGNSVLTDRPDTVLRLARTKLAVELTSEKLRNGEPWEKLRYQYVVRVDEESGLFVVKRRAAIDREAVEEAVREVGESLATVSERLREEGGLSERTVRRIMAEGEKEGWLERGGPKNERWLKLVGGKE